jgi:hypothetical protein
MTFAQRRNRLTTYFSERIPVVKRLMTTSNYEVRLAKSTTALYIGLNATGMLRIPDGAKHAALYSNTFQDIPRLRETADNTERYIHL